MTEPQGKALLLNISDIRTDGETQCRIRLHEPTVENYAILMSEGVEFPPIVVWFDGASYWLSDGFQRIAAARRAGLTAIHSVVHEGGLSDAKWHSYSANGDHGLRRTAMDTALAIRRALSHPKGGSMSNVQLAKHMGLPEATIRRWRNRLSLPQTEDKIRLVVRGGKQYTMNTAAIGQSGSRRGVKSKRNMGADLTQAIRLASPEVAGILNVFFKWIVGAAELDTCLQALESIAWRLKTESRPSQRVARGGER